MFSQQSLRSRQSSHYSSRQSVHYYSHYSSHHSSFYSKGDGISAVKHLFRFYARYTFGNFKPILIVLFITWPVIFIFSNQYDFIRYDKVELFEFIILYIIFIFWKCLMYSLKNWPNIQFILTIIGETLLLFIMQFLFLIYLTIPGTSNIVTCDLPTFIFINWNILMGTIYINVFPSPTVAKRIYVIIYCSFITFIVNVFVDDIIIVLYLVLEALVDITNLKTNAAMEARMATKEVDNIGFYYTTSSTWYSRSTMKQSTMSDLGSNINSSRSSRKKQNRSSKEQMFSNLSNLNVEANKKKSRINLANRNTRSDFVEIFKHPTNMKLPDYGHYQDYVNQHPPHRMSLAASVSGNQLLPESPQIMLQRIASEKSQNLSSAEHSALINRRISNIKNQPTLPLEKSPIKGILTSKTSKTSFSAINSAAKHLKASITVPISYLDLKTKNNLQSLKSPLTTQPSTSSLSGSKTHLITPSPSQGTPSSGSPTTNKTQANTISSFSPLTQLTATPSLTPKSRTQITQNTLITSLASSPRLSVSLTQTPQKESIRDSNTASPYQMYPMINARSASSPVVTTNNRKHSRNIKSSSSSQKIKVSVNSKPHFKSARFFAKFSESKETNEESKSLFDSIKKFKYQPSSFTSKSIQNSTKLQQDRKRYEEYFAKEARLFPRTTSHVVEPVRLSPVPLQTKLQEIPKHTKDNTGIHQWAQNQQQSVRDTDTMTSTPIFHNGPTSSEKSTLTSQMFTLPRQSFRLPGHVRKNMSHESKTDDYLQLTPDHLKTSTRLSTESHKSKPLLLHPNKAGSIETTFLKSLSSHDFNLMLRSSSKDTMESLASRDYKRLGRYHLFEKTSSPSIEEQGIRDSIKFGGMAINKLHERCIFFNKYGVVISKSSLTFYTILVIFGWRVAKLRESITILITSFFFQYFQKAILLFFNKFVPVKIPVLFIALVKIYLVDLVEFSLSRV